MALINCKECGFKISDKAATCVHCGAPVAASAPASPPKKKPKPWLVPLLVMVVAVAVFGLSKAFPEPFEPLVSMIGLGSEKPAAVAPAPSSNVVSAITLFKDYRTNEALADISYKEKNLVINGVVDAFNKNAEAPSVALSGGGPAKAVQAQFPKNALDKLSTLKRGQKITVTCMGGGMLNGTPVLKSCAMYVM